VRVLLDYRPALRRRSGVGEYVHQLARALAASEAGGDELVLFSSSLKDRVAGDAVPGAEVIDRRVPVRALNLAWHRLGWPPVERLTRRNVDVAHSPHPLLMPASRAATVVTIHDLAFLDHPEWTAAEVRRDYASLVRSHAQRADLVITPSRHVAGEITRRLDVANEQIAVCPHGAPRWTARSAAPPDGYLLFMGTLEPRKNVGRLLGAYRWLTAERPAAPALVLAGGATAAAAPWIEAMSQAPLAGRVQHIGYVEERDRLAVYQGAHALVLPSLDEGFGLPVVEAMAAGVPVVASNRGALPEVVGDAGLIVDLDEPLALERALLRLVDEPSLADELSRAGAARVAQFTWERSAAAHREAYATAVARRRRRLGTR
jgi:glycosyltransferase involved in cell wall biosynthesis